jgi:hypothetical protein
VQLVITIYGAHQLQLKVQLVSTVCGPLMSQLQLKVQIVSTVYRALMSQLQVKVQLIFKKKREQVLPLVATEGATP